MVNKTFFMTKIKSIITLNPFIKKFNKNIRFLDLMFPFQRYGYSVKIIKEYIKIKSIMKKLCTG